MVKHRLNESGSYPHRMVFCHRATLPDTDGVSVLHYPESGSSGYRGVMTCGAQTCPICGPKIGARRRDDLAAALDGQPYRQTLLTLTLQHRRGEPLRVVLTRLIAAWSRLDKSRAWRTLVNECGMVGRGRGLEVTVGHYGWHPHLHLLILTDPDAGRSLADAESEIRQLWAGNVKACGGYASPLVGADVSANHASPDYVVKVGLEIGDISRHWDAAHELSGAASKSARQGHVSPLGLLAASLAGFHSGGVHLSGKQAADLWLEYVAAMHGQKILVCSGVLKTLMRGLDDLSDQEIADQDREVGVVLDTLSVPDEWGRVLELGLQGQVLDAAATGDPAILQSFLLESGIRIRGIGGALRERQQGRQDRPHGPPGGDSATGGGSARGAPDKRLWRHLRVDLNTLETELVGFVWSVDHPGRRRVPAG